MAFYASDGDIESGWMIVLYMLIVFIGLPATIGAIAWATSTPDSRCESACGDFGVRTVTAQSCECER